MAITLTVSATVLALPDDLIWVDRFTWAPVEQSVERSITGAVLVDSGTRIVGRPITLAGDENAAWFSYATISQLKTWASTPDLELNLNLNGTTYNVILRHHDAPAIDVSPVIDYATPDVQDWFWGQIKFMEV